MGLGCRLYRPDWSLFWLGDALINQKCLLIPGGGYRESRSVPLDGGLFRCCKVGAMPTWHYIRVVGITLNAVCNREMIREF
jgi:hypothetical protein